MRTSTLFATATVILVSFLLHQASCNANELQELKIIKRGKYYHIKDKNGKDVIYMAEDIFSKMYKIDCFALPITEEVVPFKDDNTIICGRLAYPTTICGGQCHSGTHPKLRDQNTECTACGPGPNDKVTYEKVVECIRKDNNKLIQKTLKISEVKGCGCNRYKCGPLNKALLRYM